MRRSDSRGATQRARRASKRNRRRKSSLPLLLGALCAGLTVEAVEAALTSPRFAIRSVALKGEREIAPKEALTTADIPLGANLFRFDAKRAADRVSKLPRVKRVSIHRRLPGCVTIEVEERKPVALLTTGFDYYLIDDEEIPYAKMDASEHQLPVLRLETAPKIVLGQPIRDPAFETGMKSLAETAKYPMGKGSLWVDSRLNLCLNKGDFSARLGQPDDLDRKLKLLESLLESDPQLPDKAQYVDVSAPESPAMLPRVPAASLSTASAQ